MQAQQVEEQEQPQPEDPRRSPPPDKEERGTAPDPNTQSESEPGVEEAKEDASARRRVAPRVVINFSEEEKEIVIDFLQQNPTLYSKRLAGYKDTAAKDRLWAEQARQMNLTPSELKTWYESMHSKQTKEICYKVRSSSRPFHCNRTVSITFKSITGCLFCIF